MARQRNDWIDRVVYGLIRLGAMLFQMFPINLNLRTARVLGRIWWRLRPRHRDLARQHLRLAYGDALPAREIDRLALASMQQMTMLVIELIFTPRLINEWTWPRYIRLRGGREFLDTLLQRRGSILLTAHYGNWELLGMLLTAIGFPVVAVMRPLDNPYLNRYLLATREKRGLQLLYKKGASRAAEDVLNSGGSLCFIADQNAGHKGEFVDFFGVKASTYRSIGLLAIQHNVPIVVGYARRTSPRFEYEVGCSRIIRPEEWADRDDELHWVTQEYTAAIERFVREAPEQYLWIHRRWKSRPRGEAETVLNVVGAGGASVDASGGRP